MFKRTVPLILALLLSFPLAAQNVRIEHFELPNGLDVVLNEDHNAPLVAINVWYHVGSKNEKPGRNDAFQLPRPRSLARVGPDQPGAPRHVNPDRSVILIVGKASEVREPLQALGYRVGVFDIEGRPLPQ